MPHGLTLRVLNNATLTTMVPGDRPYGLIEHGALVLEGERIAWIGAMADLPRVYADHPAENLKGRLVSPALIDCHTHIVFAGNRAGEFESRLKGASYAEIARAGGGIRSTVAAVRSASEDALLAAALPRLDSLLADGVGTVEVKSGYGLNTETELRMLRVARKLALERPVHIKTSFLGAHALPPEFDGQADAYIDLVCKEMLPAAAAEGLVDAVDGFCESIGFTPAQIERVFMAATDLGLPVKLHAEQLSDLGGAVLTARHGGLSADHLEHLGSDGVAAMADAGTVAVLLPGAYYTLSERQAPPVDALRNAGVSMAVATDCNPGSSPLVSLLLAMNMACTLFRLTPEEALAGTTRNAAKALGVKGGTLSPDQRADIAIWDVGHPAELAYVMGHRPLYRRLHGGRDV